MPEEAAEFFGYRGKRVLDIAVAVIATPIVAAVLPVVAAAIKMDDGGPIFYRSRRLGRDQVPFDMFKFRTMKVNATDHRNDDGTTYNSKEDSRVTRVGRFLRRSSVDELPQILNVMRGEMSVVGPRPSPVPAEKFLVEGYENKFRLRPGMTGLAQVLWRNVGLLRDRQQSDLDYLRQVSLREDLKILARTVSVVRSGRDLHRNTAMSADSSGIYNGSRVNETRNKRIIFATTTCTGAPSLYRGQLEWFSKRGWKPVLVCAPSEEGAELGRREGVEYFPLPMEREISPVSDVRSLALWFRLLRMSHPYAVNVGTPKAGLIGGVAAFLCRVPKRVYTVRGLRLEGEAGSKRALLWLMERIAVATATDVIAVSRSLGSELLKQRLVPPRKLWITGNGSSNGVDARAVQSAVFSAEKAALREKLGVSEEDFVIGYIGRIHKDKGIDTLLDAVDSLTDPSIRLVLVGANEDPTMQGALAEAGRRVVAAGWSREPWKYLAVFDILVLPTRREGLPNVVLEAAAAGVPAVVTDATGAVDSVVDKETGIIFGVGDVAALALAITQLSEDRELAERLGNAARQWVEANFSQLAIWRGIEDIITGSAPTRGAVRLKNEEEE